MRGTLVCGLTDGEEAVGTVALAVELTERLGCGSCSRTSPRHPADADGLDGDESVTMKGDREGAARLLDQLGGGARRGGPRNAASPSASRPRCSGRSPPRRPPT